ncbi:exosortase/archaeosortase family protein [Methylicorpusculum sp.]|uniref:exosortase/archaeosortase family protein n=1 Tax=Methylicorpusculum sp. TaxID=2713644 RepID=UPI002726C86D|nr:exosortase/archaeosortase family protein [Methylicorpusculum sp.]MDO8845987.1 exosortase/archaeosortase family protein [Methylicorpusculum sp.]MDP2177116.1 exosortase/archaeosortase family protein [Methylicorpusculum sp.]MDP3531258.1 exosortase/archaeosortase family protein [Methylicorpusculum sp.]MDZ4153078.1 exosortase/archaeosortase family protein [Methylicorpusculum sp.]
MITDTQIPLQSQYSSSDRWLLGFAATLFVLVFAPTLSWLWGRWTMSVWQNGHGILVTLLVIYLVREELIKRKDLPQQTSAWGFAILIPALIIHMLDTGLNSQLLSAFAFFMSLPGLALLFLGLERSKAILFPLIILMLTLPIPLVFTESLHMGLRIIATKSVAWLLKILGVPVYSTGTILQVENGTLQVADACSGFSTLYAAVTIAILTAYFCNSTKRRILLLIIAAPLAIAVNIARVLILTLLVNWIGLDVLATAAHEISGLMTFMIALPIIFMLGQNPREPENLTNEPHP